MDQIYAGSSWTAFICVLCSAEREREIQLTCCFVHSNIPFGPEVSLRVIRALLNTTDNSPEALGMQESLHFALPG